MKTTTIVIDNIEITIKTTPEKEPQPSCDAILQPVDIKTLEPLNIAENARECLMMLKYWDDKEFTDNPPGHKVEKMNTTKVIKSFLEKLIKNFPKQ